MKYRPIVLLFVPFVAAMLSGVLRVPNEVGAQQTPTPQASDTTSIAVLEVRLGEIRRSQDQLATSISNASGKPSTIAVALVAFAVVLIAFNVVVDLI